MGDKALISESLRDLEHVLRGVEADESLVGVEGPDVATSVQVLFQQMNKLSIMYSQDPVKGQDIAQLCSCAVDAARFFGAACQRAQKHPASNLLRKEIGGYLKSVTSSAADSVHSMLEEAPGPSKAHIKKMARLMQLSDGVRKLPQTDHDALHKLIGQYAALLEDAMSDLQDEDRTFDDFGDDLSEDPDFQDQDLSWTEAEKQVLDPAASLIKVALKTLSQTDKPSTRRLLTGDIDGLADRVKALSSACDEFVVTLYAPMALDNVAAMGNNFSQEIRSILTTVESMVTGTQSPPAAESEEHVSAAEPRKPELPWLEFLRKALQHNLDKLTQRIADASSGHYSTS